MSAVFKVGDRVRFSDDVPEYAIDAAGYGRNDSLTVLAVETHRLDDGAESCNCLVSGRRWVVGHYLVRAQEIATPIETRLVAIESAAMAIMRAIGLLSDGQVATADAIAGLALALQDDEDEAAPEAPAPEPTPSDFRITGPGKYRTRCGGIATITRRFDAPESCRYWQWEGTYHGVTLYFATDGRVNDTADSSADLVGRAS